MSVEEQNPLATQKISSLILKFTIPAIISMMVSSLYNIVDQILLDRVLVCLEMQRQILHSRSISSVPR